MSKPTPEVSVAPSEKSPHPAGCLVRIAWMLVGNVILAILAIRIAERRDFEWHLADTLYWAVVLALVLLRWVDVRALKGETASGQPATFAHWKRYAVLLFVAALLVWAAAHAAAGLR